MTDIEAITTDWYESLLDDCRAIITESEFNSRMELVVGYHQLGMRIATDEGYKKAAKGNRDVCKGIANNLGKSERLIYLAIQFYTKYPDLELLSEGKNLSWTMIVKKYLSAPDTISATHGWNYYLPRVKTLYADLLDVINDKDRLILVPPAVKQWLLDAPEEVK